MVYRLVVREDAVPGEMMSEMKEKRQELIGKTTLGPA